MIVRVVCPYADLGIYEKALQSLAGSEARYAPFGSVRYGGTGLLDYGDRRWI